MGFYGYFLRNGFFLGCFLVCPPYLKDSSCRLVLDKLPVLLCFCRCDACSQKRVNVHKEPVMLPSLYAPFEDISFSQHFIGCCKLSGVCVLFRQVFVNPEELLIHVFLYIVKCGYCYFQVCCLEYLVQG